MATYCSKRRKTPLSTFCLYLELIAALLIGKTVGALSSTPADVTGTKVCIGTNSHLSVPSNREHHYRNLRDRYNNCTYVDGNLELTWLQDESLDLSFLENIREVTGYILISHMDVPRVILPRLQIIRGRTLFNLHNHDEHFALSVTYSKMFTLELPALRDILHGSVEFFNNFNLCHVKSIDWTEIISGPNGTYNYVYDFQPPERECPKCHESCEKGCWGDGPQNCQQFSKVNCSPQCEHGRCFGTQPRECCHLFCAGGCTGPTLRECIACKNFYDDGVCKEECPPMQKYNSIKYLWEDNPAGKYAYGATCVKECPEHLLKDSGACVRSCPTDKMAKEGECVPCNGPCPKTCAGSAVINSGNIDSYKGCTIIEGSIRILEQSFDGYQDFYNNTIGPRYIAMHPERLDVFSTVKEITGYLDVEGAHPAFENLSCFRNLEVIHGRQLMENYFASLSIVRTSLKSLGLKSLKRINSGAVVIQQNERLCYAGGIDWMQLQKSTDHGFVIAKNRLESECANDGFICSKQCDAAGCWSSGNDQCLQCKNFAFNGTCLADCGEMKNTYQFDAKICRQCHSECESCSGPSAEHCHECKHVKDQHHCVPQCPINKYAYFGICLNCDESCDGCYGANNTIGSNGCKTCDLAIINNDDSIQCLRRNEKCPDGYYWEYVIPQEQGNLQPLAGKAVCRKCHPRCELCSGYGFHEQVCLKCAGFKRGEQCEDECPSDYYADNEKGECFECHPECKGCTGPGLNKCLACRNFKVFGDVSSFDNATAFNCTSKCPSQLPHVIYRTSHIGAYCSSSRAKLVAGMENYLLVIIIAVPFVVLLCGIFLVLYICRQKLRAKKDAVKMTMVLSGCDDAEPLRPTNIGANLTKLRIIKESALRKGGMLGMGAFGRVYKGVWMPEGENLKIPVAIKELHKASGVDTSEEFLREAYIMASVEHPHLLKLLAVCMASQMMLVTQLMPLGCLLDYVRNNREKISSKSFLNWCTQIAKGMAYLEEKRLVHRDLAARNVLVQTPACVKITDFGLAKLLSSDSNEYKAAGGKMPIKWLALECIQHRVFTSKSDVWAFGVTVWELLTYGQRPYEHISAKDLVYEIEKGLKLEQPEICSLDVYLTLITCWHIDSEARPTFKQLVSIFSDFARDPGRYLAIPGDSFIRTPAFNTQTEGEELKNLAAVADNSIDAEKGATGFNKGVEVSNDMGKLNSYCKDPMNRQVVEKQVLCLNLPVDEDDYLLPSCKKTGTIFNNNLNNNNNHGDVNAENAVGYLDVLGAPNGVDNPEYLLEAKGANKSRSGVMMNYANVNDELNGKHEYYNDADVGGKKESCV